MYTHVNTHMYMQSHTYARIETQIDTHMHALLIHIIHSHTHIAAYIRALGRDGEELKEGKQGRKRRPDTQPRENR